MSSIFVSCIRFFFYYTLSLKNKRIEYYFNENLTVYTSLDIVVYYRKRKIRGKSLRRKIFPEEMIDKSVWTCNKVQQLIEMLVAQGNTKIINFPCAFFS